MIHPTRSLLHWQSLTRQRLVLVIKIIINSWLVLKQMNSIANSSQITFVVIIFAFNSIFCSLVPELCGTLKAFSSKLYSKYSYYLKVICFFSTPIEGDHPPPLATYGIHVIDVDSCESVDDCSIKKSDDLIIKSLSFNSSRCTVMLSLPV